MGKLRDFFFRSGRSRQKRDKGEGGEETPPAPAPPDPSEATVSPKRHGRLRRSLNMKKLRSSFRRKETYVPPASKPHQWQVDEKLVRAGTCSYAVKYLGSVQVNESRGMHICEEAAKHLRSNTKKKVRAILWVGSDGLRVVEDESKGLLVDQTIEKVSFCAPDRNHEKGFSYISRDGTTRRWLCHCFLSLKEPGERLSHAVGCAFAACLERKQQRDKLCGVQVEFDVNKTSFTRQGSFRQTTMTEQLEADEKAKENQPETATTQAVVSPVQPQQPFARPRRHATNDLLMRARSSFRGQGQLSEQSPFKRSTSLRLNELPSTLLRQQQVLQTHHELSPIHSPTSPTVPENFTQQAAMPSMPAAIPQPPNQPVYQPGIQNGTTTNLSAACQQLTNGLFELSSQQQEAGFSVGMTTTPTTPPQQQPQMMGVQPQLQQGVAVNGAVVRPAHLGQQPIGQPVQMNHQVIGQQTSVPIQQAVPPQLPPRTLQPTVEPIKQTNPWETTPSPPQQPSHNPWGGATPSGSTTTTPTQARLTEAEKWLVQTSQTVSPLGSPQQQVAQVQVHSGGSTPIQNGHGQVPATYQQQPSLQQQQQQQAMVVSMNYNNANNAATVVNIQSPATQYNNTTGISGSWTNDMSRTLPNANLQQNGNSNSSSKVDNFEAKWDEASDHPSKPNPFKNATKTFEINL